MIMRVFLFLIFVAGAVLSGLDIYRQEYSYLMFDVILTIMTGLLFMLLGDFEKNKEMFR